LQGEFNEVNAQFSPDGRWIAYSSDVSGRNEIYVASRTSRRGGQQLRADFKGAMTRLLATAKEGVAQIIISPLRTL
jgi:Tol biopolymer transport system component